MYIYIYIYIYIKYWKNHAYSDFVVAFGCSEPSFLHWSLYEYMYIYFR